MKKAAEYAIEGVEKQLRTAEDSKAPSFSDCNSNSYISCIGNKQTPGTLSNMQNKYFEKLPECYLISSMHPLVLMTLLQTEREMEETA
jgi:hypothetical protein